MNRFGLQISPAAEANLGGIGATASYSARRAVSSWAQRGSTWMCVSDVSRFGENDEGESDGGVPLKADQTSNTGTVKT